MPPNHCTGRSPATGASDSAARGVPAQITAAVPSTGTRAIAPGNSSAVGERARRDGDRGEADPRGEGARAPQPLPHDDGHDGEQAAHAELPGPRERREVREVVVLSGQDHAVHERGHRRDREHRRDERHATTSEPHRQPEREDDEQRPHEVELLLDRQRPEVLHRRRLEVGAVRDLRVACEVPVLHVERAREDLLQERPPLHLRHEQERRHRAGAQHHERGRQDAPGPAHVELLEPHPPVPLGVAEQEPRDQEAGDDEEHVDADEARRECGGPEVVEHDAADRHGTERLDLGPHGGSHRGRRR